MKLNTIFCLLLIIAGFIVPSIAFGSGIIPPNSFWAIFIKTISVIALITLVTNAVSVLAYKDRR
jgi:hypothetical protein